MHYLLRCALQLYICLYDMQLSEIDFQDSLKAIGLSEELQQALLQQYVDNRAFIRSIQKELSMDLPHYTNLEWRLDVKVTSRHVDWYCSPEC